MLPAFFCQIRCNGVCVARHVRRADSFWAQLRGVIGRHLAPGEAVLLAGCRQVHTAFVAYPLTVAFVAPVPAAPNTYRVLAVQTLAPWRIGAFVPGAVLAIEMRAGDGLSGCRAGDLLVIAA